MYSLQPIRNREDHQAALKEIERLFDAKQGTPEFDQLDILVTLVEAYEDKHEPILPPEPIEAILYYLESRGLTKQALESAIGNQD
jgi:HTH-type transcriptional regulator / antitoxin HigA